MQRRKKIGELLVEGGLVTERDVAFALSEKHINEPLIETLVRLGIITPSQEMSAWDLLAEQLKIPHLVPGRDFYWDQELSEKFSAELASQYKSIPVKVEEEFLWVGMIYPMDLKSLEAIRIITGSKVRQSLLSMREFQSGMSIVYDEEAPEIEGDIEFDLSGFESPGPGKSDKSTYFGLDDEPETEVIYPHDRMETILLDIEDGDLAPTVRLFHSLLKRSVLTGASDIHIEPSKEKAEVRFRIDGVLLSITEVPGETVPSLVAAIKVQCDMDIAEKRLPQDGRFTALLSGQEIDFRVSTLPTVFGEKVVLRLLRRGTGLLRLDRLGLDEKAESAVLRSIAGNSGIVLITGPTGSGKSTTLYSVLRELDLAHLNVITIEDPVEYKMAGVSQVNVRSDIGLTFASILRTVLRQDPDVVMLGEIRDVETAEMAIRAALTGHLVLSTLHTNSAPATIDRLLDMGIPSYLLGSAMRFIGAQRLVRKVCQECSVSYTPKEHVLAMFDDHELEGIDFRHGAGCEKCSYTGYNGRLALLEFLEIKGRVVRLVSRGADSSEIRDAATKDDLYYNIKVPGLDAVRKGILTIEEVARVMTDV